MLLLARGRKEFKKKKKKESRVHAGHETHVGGSIYEHDSKETL